MWSEKWVFTTVKLVLYCHLSSNHVILSNKGGHINFSAISHGPNKAFLVLDSWRMKGKKWLQYNRRGDRRHPWKQLQCLFLLFLIKFDNCSGLIDAAGETQYMCIVGK
jgi:hypothetical protein